MPKKKLTKQDIIASDAVNILFTVIITFCFIACAVVSIFIVVCGCIYLVKAFSFDGDKVIKALTLAVLMLLSSALFIYLDIRIFKTVKLSLSNYVKERQTMLDEINSEANTDSNDTPNS